MSLPIAHNFALGCPGALGTLYAGGTVVFCKDPSPEAAFRLIEQEKITVTALIPPLVLLWLEAAEWVRADLSSLRWIQAEALASRPRRRRASDPSSAAGCSRSTAWRKGCSTSRGSTIPSPP